MYIPSPPQWHRSGDLRGTGAGRHCQDLHRLQGGHHRGGERVAPQEGVARAAQVAGAEGHRAVEGRTLGRRQEEAAQIAQGRVSAMSVQGVPSAR